MWHKFMSVGHVPSTSARQGFFSLSSPSPATPLISPAAVSLSLYICFPPPVSSVSHFPLSLIIATIHNEVQIIRTAPQMYVYNDPTVLSGAAVRCSVVSTKPTRGPFALVVPKGLTSASSSSATAASPGSSKSAAPLIADGGTQQAAAPSWTVEESRYALSLLLPDALLYPATDLRGAANAAQSADIRAARLSLLRDEIDNAVSQATSGALFGIASDALENMPQAVSDDTFMDLINQSALRLTLKDKLWLLVALSCASGESRASGRRLLIRCLKDHVPQIKILDTLKQLDSVLLCQQLALALQSSASLDAPPTSGGASSASAAAAPPPQNGGEQGFIAEVCSKALDVALASPFVADAQHANITLAAQASLDSVSIAQLMEELGPSCFATPDDVRQLFDLATPVGGQVTAQDIANCIVVLSNVVHKAKIADTAKFSSWADVRYATMLGEATSPMPTGPPSSSASSASDSGWNTANFLAVLKERAPALSWQDVLTKLDVPSFKPESPSQLVAILGTYRKATGQLAPVASFLRPVWKNSAAQLQVVRYLVGNPATADRQSLLPSSVVVDTAEGLVASAGDLNPLFRSPPFTSLLAVLGAAGYKEASQMLNGAARTAPVVIAASLLSCKEPSFQVVCAQQALTILNATPTALNATLLNVVTEAGNRHGLLWVIAQHIQQGDATRFSALSVGLFVQDASLYQGLLQPRPIPGSTPQQQVLDEPTHRLLAMVHVFGMAAGATTLADAMAPLNAASSAVSLSGRVAFAAALVEACDEAVALGVMAADSAVVCGVLHAVLESAGATMLGAYPSLVSHARQLLQAAGAKDVAPVGSGVPQSGASTAPQTYGKDVETAATEFLSRMFQAGGTSTLDEAIALSKSSDRVDRETLACIASTLLEEAKHVSSFPDKQMRIFATFYGQAISHNLFPSTATLQAAVKIVLLAVRNPIDQRCLDFGIQALTIFKDRVAEWPSLGQQLAKVPDLDMRVPGIMAVINGAAAKAAVAAAEAQATGLVGQTVANASPETSGTASPLPAGSAATSAVPGSVSGLHQLDVRVLSHPDASIVPPPTIVQDRINFLITNTDPSRVDATASELRSILKPEFYPFFSDYLVVRRVSLEPNNHRMYVTLLERMDSAELLAHIRLTTIGACRRLMDSDKIRTVTGERALLKSLGTWLGLVTLAINVPILLRDLDLKSLIPKAVQEGKLIPIVPFVCKILESSGHSRVFRPRNPWTMAMLAQLTELYLLPELKMTLRFEVEVLFKNLQVHIGEVNDYRERFYGNPRVPLLELKRKYVDVNNSMDFRPELQPTDAGMVASLAPSSTKLSSDAAPYQPKGMMLAGGGGSGVGGQQTSTGSSPPPQQGGHVGMPFAAVQQQQQPQLLGAGVEPRIPPQVYQLLPHISRPNIRQTVLLALDTAAKDVAGAIDRFVLITVTTTRDVVVKDFTTDQDDAKLRLAAISMARCLCVNLFTVQGRDTVNIALRKGLLAALQPLMPGNVDPQLADSALEALHRENLDILMPAAEAFAGVKAQLTIEQALSAVLAERHRAVVSREFPIVPEDQQRKAAFIASLPEELHPRNALHQAHLTIYSDFASLVPHEEQYVLNALQVIEDASVKHYVANYPLQTSHLLRATDRAFMDTDASEHHVTIKRKMQDITQHSTEASLSVVVAAVFQRLVYATEKLLPTPTPEQQANKQLMAAHYGMMLLHDVCMFLLRHARERGQPAKVVAEVTKHFLSLERKWFFKELVTVLCRAQCMDVAELDRALTAALQESASTSAPPPSTATTAAAAPPTALGVPAAVAINNNRAVVEFAGFIVQRCIIDEKTLHTKDLRGTLDILEKIAQNTKKAKQSSVGGTGSGSSHPTVPANVVAVRVPSAHAAGDQRDTIEQFFRDWIAICHSRKAAGGGGAAAGSNSSSVPSAPGGQDAASHAADGTDPAAGATASGGGKPGQQTQQMVLTYVSRLQQNGMLKIDGALDRFLGIAIEMCIEDFATNAFHLEHPPHHAAGRAMVASTVSAPQSRFPSDPKLFSYIDAFSDLVIVLIKCCAWSQPRSTAAAADGSGAQQAAAAASNAAATKSASQAEIALVTKIVTIVTKVLQHNHDYFATPSTASTATPKLPEGHILQDSHMQQPFLRFYSNLLIALQPSSHGDDAAAAGGGGSSSSSSGVATTSASGSSSSTSTEIFSIIAAAFHYNSPMRLPGFAFAWIELIGHRVFFARMLKNQSLWGFYFKLLADAVRFLEPFVRHGEIPNSMLIFYKCTLKIFLLLLHDFPEFLLAYHQLLCDIIHVNCVQLRNVVLSAFPRATKLPDPFQPALRIEQLPECQVAPSMAGNIKDAFNSPPSSEGAASTAGSKSHQPPFSSIVSREELETFLLTSPLSGGSATAPRYSKASQALLSTIVNRLRSATAANPQGRTNVPLLNTLVLFTGVITSEKFAPSSGQSYATILPTLPAVDLYKEIMVNGDSELRYFFCSACVNQLRYPNSHTWFFSSVLLHLFLHVAPCVLEVVQEFITRVLVERLIITRPHPWGLLITFIELVKNGKYEFWDKPFIRCAPEIERMFESVGTSVNSSAAAGSAAAQAARQQQGAVGGPQAPGSATGGGAQPAGPVSAAGAVLRPPPSVSAAHHH